MPDCDYCDATFEDEAAYLDHLEADHARELGAIDQRRIEQRGAADGDGGTSSTAVYAAGGLVLLLGAAAVVYGVVSVIGAEGQVHEHGTMEVVIDGQPVDFQQPQYQNANGFHFHPGETGWHMHPSEPGRLTLAEAMDRLGIEVTEETVTFDGETYDDADPDTDVRIAINDEPVDPETAELHDGDHVEIVVETDG